MTVQLTSPHPFAERMLFFGGGGAGKSESVLNIMSHTTDDVTMRVIECDYSASYLRALATDYVDIGNSGRVIVETCDPDWDPFIEQLIAFVKEGDPDRDWLVIDPAHGSYDWVQNWVLEQVHGGDLPRMLMELKRDNPDAKAYGKARSDLMNWELVKKEYGKFWKEIMRWKGNLILTAEAKPVRTDEKDDETRLLYGPLGFMPAGQATMRHVASTNLLFDHPKRGVWRITTVKDRNREELDKERVDDFGLDYLVAVAGWERAK